MIDPFEPSFLVASCGVCAARVPGARVLNEAGALVWCCVRCDAPLDESSGVWVDAGALESLGYTIPSLREAPKHGAEGGCRGGQCGVQQP